MPLLLPRTKLPFPTTDKEELVLPGFIRGRKPLHHVQTLLPLGEVPPNVRVWELFQAINVLESPEAEWFLSIRARAKEDGTAN